MTQVSSHRPPLLLQAWWLLLALPSALLLLWLSVPALDIELRDNPPHFWIIGAAGALALTAGVLLSEAARRRSDARVFLVSLSFLCNAGFLLLHALATPNVLVSGRSIGFILAAPVGIAVGAVFALLSSLDLSGRSARRLMRYAALVRAALLALLLFFGVVALLKLPPLSLIPDPEQLDTPPFFCLIGEVPLPGFQLPATIALLLGAALYGVAAIRYLALARQQQATVLLGLAGSFALLMITTLNVGLGRTWQLSWWQWHLLLLIAFLLLLQGVYRQYRREGSTLPVFDSLFLDETRQQIRQEYTSALESLVAAIEGRGEETTGVAPVAGELARQFGLSEGQVGVLEQAAEALAADRAQIARLGALVAIGEQASVSTDEAALLARAIEVTSKAFGDDRLWIGLVENGRLGFIGGPLGDPRAYEQVLASGEPQGSLGHMLLPLMVKGRVAGVLEAVRRRGDFAERDRYLLLSLASQLSTSLENARLYQQIDALFRQYMPADVATALLADPSQAALGGAVQDVSVLFGDLRGFTTLAERMPPPELVSLLNRYFGAATGAVLGAGGTIDKFMGDALMALFNAPSRQPDHALRACQAALAMQRAVAPIAAQAPDLPRFGIGITTGPALVGNIGSETLRNFTAIGDTVNLASRLQSRAGQGQVLISAATYELVKSRAQVQPLGQISVKGKAELVEAYVLLELRDPA